MRLTWIALGSARWPRLAVLVFAAAILLGAVSVSSAQEAAKGPALAFQNDAGLIVFFVKADKTADFEELMTKLKDGLAKMDAPEAKQQLASMKLFKNPVGEKDTTAVYVLFADPVVKNVEYWFLPILYKAYPAEAQALYQKWQDAKAATAPLRYDLSPSVKFQ
jgi:hypothetical protein